MYCKFTFSKNSRLPTIFRDDFGDDVRKPPSRVFDSEYYNLPPIEKLSLDDKGTDKQQLQPMGTVLNIIEFVGKRQFTKHL